MKRTILIVVLILCACLSAYGQSASPIDLVLVLDTSSRMSSSYENVNNYLTGAFLTDFLRVGDTFHLVPFSGNPRLDVARRINGVGDVETIIGRMLLQYPVENSGNVGAALNFAEQYVTSLPSRPKKIVLVTIGGSDTGNLVNASKQRLGTRATLDYIQVTPGSQLTNLPSSGRPAPAVRSTTAASSRASSAAPSVTNQGGRTASTGTTTTSPGTSTGTSTGASSASTAGTGAATTAATGTSASSAGASSTAGTTGSTSAASSSSSTGTTDSGRQTGQTSSAATTGSPSTRADTSSSNSGTTTTSSTTGNSTVSSTGSSSSDTGTTGTNSAVSSQSSGANEQSSSATSSSTSKEPASNESTQTTSSYAGTEQRDQNEKKSFASSMPLIIGIIIGVLLLLGLIILLASRRLGSSPNRVMRDVSSSGSGSDGAFKDHSKELASYAAGTSGKRTTPYDDRKKNTENVKQPVINPAGPLLLNLFVEDQNTSIGKRNIHSLKSGYGLSVGGGKADDYLIFLVPMPPALGEIKREGATLTFIPKKPKYFPDIGSNQVRDCINKTIRVVSDKKYEMHFRFEMYEDPLVALNRMLMSVKVPG